MRDMRDTRARRPSRVGAAAFLAAVVCSTLVLAQTPAGQLTDDQSVTVGQLSGNTPQPTFRAGVTLVTTDAIPRDPNGVFISDLTKEGFRVLEDGVEQQVVTMTLVHGGRVYNRLSLAAPVQEGIILPSTRPVDDTAGRIFILFVDDLHLVTNSTPKVRAVYKEIIDTLIHEGDLAGVISTGPSSLAIQMTYDRALLYAAGERIMGDGFNVNETLLMQDGPRGPEELRFRAHVAFKTARQVLKNLEQETNRRKVFLFLSNGYDFNPFPESRLYNSPLFGLGRYGRQQLANGEIDQDQFDNLYGSIPDPITDPFERQSRAGSVFADADLGIDIAELARAANRANTTFYTIDPRGLVAGPGVTIEENVDIAEWYSFIFKSQSSLRMLAELTGGMALVNRNDFGDALRQIDSETSDYYILGFYTSNPDPTVRTRKLEIEVVGRDDQRIEVQHRSHYTLPRGPA